MVDNKLTEKEMVISVLQKADKPLMAKRIAYQIFNSFNGYRLSRYRVRDILWKEIEHQVEYDKDNYTYALIEDAHDLRKRDFIENELSEFKGVQSLKEYIHSEIDFNISPKILPFIYNIEFRDEIQKTIDYWANRVNQLLLNKHNVGDTFLSIIKRIKGGVENCEDWDIIYSLIWILKKRDGSLEKRELFKILKEKLSNPFHYALLQFDLTAEKRMVNFSNKKFQEIFEECARDNIISYSEELYLKEKAIEYGISHSRLLEALDSTDLKAYKSFKLLVDEICEDGIITENERRYINDKAKQYNITQAQLERMISFGLFKVKTINDLKSNNLFLDYLKTLFFLQALNVDPAVINIYDETLDSDTLNDLLRVETNSMIDDIIDGLYNYFDVDLQFRDVDEILNYFNLPVLDVDSIGANENISDYKFNDIYIRNSDVKIIDGSRYKIQWISAYNRPLFSEEYINSTYVITLNSSHWIFSRPDTSEIELMEKLILGLYSTKSEYTSSIIENFMNKLVGRLDLLKYEFNEI